MLPPIKVYRRRGWQARRAGSGGLLEGATLQACAFATNLASFVGDRGLSKLGRTSLSPTKITEESPWRKGESRGRPGKWIFDFYRQDRIACEQNGHVSRQI